MVANDAVQKALSNSRFANDILRRCEEQFRSLVVNVDQREGLLDLLLNEFASVLDAEGIRRGTEQAQKYMSGYRDEWMVRLQSTAEREAVLFIHDLYCDALDQSEFLSMDQMIGDFSRYLTNSAEWRQLKNRATNRKGFDLIFVDEFHYFTKIEAGIFHNLFSGDQRELLPLFMAYDLKQSPTEAGINTASLFRAAGAGETKLIELDEVFRSKPEIVSFLSDLDGAFPAYQMADDWKKYPSQNHEFKSESPPTLRVFRKNSELLDAIFASAQREANLLGGRQVAVLCSNDELFKKYLSVGRINDKFSAISSRDEISDLRYVRTKPVFSMPQYVSGLQFNTVYMLHIDRDDLLDGSTETERRRFVTRCYSGASRAVNTLQVASSEERGGPSPILKSALQRGSIVQI